MRPMTRHEITPPGNAVLQFKLMVYQQNPGKFVSSEKPFAKGPRQFDQMFLGAASELKDAEANRQALRVKIGSFEMRLIL